MPQLGIMDCPANSRCLEIFKITYRSSGSARNGSSLVAIVYRGVESGLDTALQLQAWLLRCHHPVSNFQNIFFFSLIVSRASGLDKAAIIPKRALQLQFSTQL